MADIDLRHDLAEGRPLDCQIIVAEDRPEYDQLRAVLEARGDQASHDVVPSPGNWAEVDPFGDALIPQDIIRAIVDRLREGP